METVQLQEYLNNPVPLDSNLNKYDKGGRNGKKSRR
jgi:hypothetical protein